MKFKDIMKLLPKDETQDLSIRFGSWQSGSIECDSSERYEYFLITLTNREVVGISTYQDFLEVVLV